MFPVSVLPTILRRSDEKKVMLGADENGYHYKSRVTVYTNMSEFVHVVLSLLNKWST